MITTFRIMLNMNDREILQQDLIQFVMDTARDAGHLLQEHARTELQISSKPDSSIVTNADLASEALILARLREKFPGDLVIAEESGRSSATRTPGQFVWIIDPLDGTTNFANKYPFYCVSIGRCVVADDGRLDPVAGVVYDPCRDKMYAAVKGQGAFVNGKRMAVAGPRELSRAFLVTGFYYTMGDRLRPEVARFERVAQVCSSIRRDGAAALDLALVAEGVYDAFWEHGLAVWDLAAGVLLVREAGGNVFNYDSHDQKDYTIEGNGVLAGSGSACAAIAALL